MPRDASGQYHVPPGTDGAPDTTIESTRYNVFIHDLEQVLNGPGTPGFGDAPADTQLYGRKSATVGGALTWSVASGGPGGASVTISDTPPASPTAGNLWWESDTGNLYIYYNDGNSSQWVLAVPSTTGGSGGPPPSTINPKPVTMPAAPGTATPYSREDHAHPFTSGLANGTDFNTVTAPGFYYTIDNTGPNAPTAGTYWYLQVEIYAPVGQGNVLQRAVSMIGVQSYIRNFTGGAWSAWKVIIDTGIPAVPLTSETAPYGTVVSQRAQVRKNIYAAPFDAMAYSGMQVNGSMAVSQERGFGTGITASGYICDGNWYLAKAAGMTAVCTCTLNTVASWFPGIPNFIGVTVQTAQATINAGDLVLVSSSIEGYRLSRLAWGTSSAQPLTIGFWTAHVRTGTYTGSVRNNAANRSYVFSYTQNVSNASEFKVVTIPGDTAGTWAIDNTAGMTLAFPMTCGSTLTAPSLNAWLAGNYVAGPGQVNGIAATSDGFYLTGVIVLPGIEAPSAARSALIMRPYDQELLTCKRYFQKIGGDASNDLIFQVIAPAGTSNTNYGTQSMTFGVEMRGVPTVLFPGTWAFSNASALVPYAGRKSMSANISATAPGPAIYYPGASGAGWMTLDARL